MNKAIETRVKMSWKKLTKKEQELSEKVIKSDFAFSDITITELANKLNVTVSTINRWTKKIGFDGFKDLSARSKIHSGFYQKYGEIFSNLQNDFFYSVSTTDKFLDYDDLEVLVNKICELKEITFYGEAFTASIASYFSYLFNKIGIQSRVINVASDIALINNVHKSVNIFVSVSGRNPNLINAYEKATFDNKIFSAIISTNNKSVLHDKVNCELVADFHQTEDIDVFELPLVSKSVIDYVLEKVFISVYLRDEEHYKKLISKIAKAKII